MEVIVKRPQIWFTSDNHYGHFNILKLGKGRPFAHVDEMNEAMIERHNALVKPGDLVYNLGDFALKIAQKEALNIRRRLNGNIYLITGNHDSIAKSMPGSWVWMRELERIHPSIDGVPPITLCHYALRTWHGSHRGTYALYGHSHGSLPELPNLLAFDVGVDCWNFTPISIEEVVAKMKTKLPAWEAYRASLPSDRAEG
jgi:calcineurin-like phosphoesterase family protein